MGFGTVLAKFVLDSSSQKVAWLVKLFWNILMTKNFSALDCKIADIVLALRKRLFAAV